MTKACLAAIVVCPRVLHAAVLHSQNPLVQFSYRNYTHSVYVLMLTSFLTLKGIARSFRPAHWRLCF